MEVSLTSGTGRLWPAGAASLRGLSFPLSQRTLRMLLSVAVYLAFVFLMHAMTSVRPVDVAAANHTYLCKRH
jgi:hypothetical protein